MSLTSCKEAQNYLNRYVLNLPGKNCFQVYYWGAVPKHYDNPVHKHSFFEICYVLGGEGTYIDDGRQYSLRKGTLFCSRPEIVHQILSRDGMFLLYVAFDIANRHASETAIRMHERLAHTDKIVVKDADDSPTALMWRALLLQSERGSSLHEDVVTELAHALLQSFELTFGEIEEPSRPQPRSTFVDQAKLFINDNLTQPLQLADVASYLHISARHLSRLFASELGQGFSQYVRQQRIERAVRLLRTTDLPIARIAEQAGFSSVHYFTRIFTAEYRMAPGQYRKAHQVPAKHQ